jgi:hypothetical protein
MACDGDSSTGPGHPTLKEGIDLCRTCWDLTIALMFGGQLRDDTPVHEIRRIVRERAQALATKVKAIVRRVLCPHCKRVVDSKPASTQDHFVLQTHDIAPMLRQVCEGSGEAASFEGAYLAAEEIERLRGWLRKISRLSHHGCAKAVVMGGTCSACCAEAALSGKDVP